mmetsp:Transcript_54917/g.100313  ORF Transcript_54917/g.100313 Transcript_54917/m.100313 type:complete len:1124 (+) Transcript_54917:138-3509(+)
MSVADKKTLQPHQAQVVGATASNVRSRSIPQRTIQAISAVQQSPGQVYAPSPMALGARLCSPPPPVSGQLLTATTSGPPGGAAPVPVTSLNGPHGGQQGSSAATAMSSLLGSSRAASPPPVAITSASVSPMNTRRTLPSSLTNAAGRGLTQPRSPTAVSDLNGSITGRARAANNEPVRTEPKRADQVSRQETPGATTPLVPISRVPWAAGAETPRSSFKKGARLRRDERESSVSATPAAPAPFQTVIPPQVSSSLRLRATSGSPLRSTLPPSWAPHSMPSSNRTIRNVQSTAVSRTGSVGPAGAGAATGTVTPTGCVSPPPPTTPGRRIVASVIADGRIHSSSPERSYTVIGGTTRDIRSLNASANVVDVKYFAPTPIIQMREADAANPQDIPYSEHQLLLEQGIAREISAVGSYAMEPQIAELRGEELHVVSRDTEPPLQLEEGAEVCLGDHLLRCLNVLGSGSYSVVWRAEVVRSVASGGNEENIGPPPVGSGFIDANEFPTPGTRMLLEKEVALKDVLCRSNAVLRQSLFEVQLLLALERRVLLEKGQNNNSVYPLRLPRCFAYKVDSEEDGWRVRTAMTRLPGEQLDDWLRRAATAVTTPSSTVPGIIDKRISWTSQLKRGITMAERLVRQIGPTLQRLAPLAWHRDVNSHNVLVSTDVAEGALLSDEPKDLGNSAMFWLIDLGLAVDAHSWVSPDLANSEGGSWRVTDIGGDCRYWPASSWMVHLYGADYLAERQDFCRQYQWRLDTFGLGITAVELLCSTALSARLMGAPPEDCETPSDVCWAILLDAWQRYYERAGHWWSQIYAVFSTGGDFRPVHAWLVEEGVADQVVTLMEDLRKGLRACMACADPESRLVLHVIAELIDEASDFDLGQLCDMLEKGQVQEAPTVKQTSTKGVQAEQTLCAWPTGPAVDASRAAEATPVLTEVASATENVQNGARDGSSTPSRRAANALDNESAGAGKHTWVKATPSMADINVQAAAPLAEVDPVAVASQAAAEGRLALESLQPIPPIAAAGASSRRRLEKEADRKGQNARRNRQAELAELVEAQAQLRHDLERLQLAKMRLQHARRLHEDKKQSAAAGRGLQASPAQSTAAPLQPGGRGRPASQGPPTRGRSR